MKSVRHSQRGSRRSTAREVLISFAVRPHHSDLVHDGGHHGFSSAVILPLGAWRVVVG